MPISARWSWSRRTSTKTINLQELHACNVRCNWLHFSNCPAGDPVALDLVPKATLRGQRRCTLPWASMFGPLQGDGATRLSPLSTVGELYSLPSTNAILL